MLRWSILLLTLLVICAECSDTVTSKEAKKKARRLSGFEIIDGLCMNSRSDRLVYRYRNESYVYIAFDILKTGMVDVFSWTVITTAHGTFISSNMDQERVFAVDFRKNVNRDHVIGATNKRYQKKFKQRMVRKMDHCKKLLKKKKHCKLSAIQSVFVRTDMREVHYRKDPYDDCEQFFDSPKDGKKKKKRKGGKKSKKSG